MTPDTRSATERLADVEKVADWLDMLADEVYGAALEGVSEVRISPGAIRRQARAAAAELRRLEERERRKHVIDARWPNRHDAGCQRTFPNEYHRSRAMADQTNSYKIPCTCGLDAALANTERTNGDG